MDTRLRGDVRDKAGDESVSPGVVSRDLHSRTVHIDPRCVRESERNPPLPAKSAGSVAPANYGTEVQIPPFLATLGRRNDKGMKNPHLVAESRDKFGAAARIDPKTSVELRSRS